MVYSITPKYIFLLDCLGAIVTAFMLGVIHVYVRSIFSLPIPTLQFLALIAICFAVFSFFNYIYLVKQWRTNMKIIAIANTLFCVYTAYLAISLHAMLKIWDFIYFVLEFLIIGAVVLLEWRTSNSK